MKKISCIVLLTLIVHPVDAQLARDSVIATVNNLFEGMKKADTILLKSCFNINTVFQTIREKDGTVTVADDKVPDFVAIVGAASAGDLDERILIGSVLIDGPLASVWTPYNFYYKGKFSHCGVNSFQLVRTGNGWKIQYLVDTRRKTRCH